MSARLNAARVRLYDAAVEMAQEGMSLDTIRAAMVDLATGAGNAAARQIARYDEREAREALSDREDFAAEYAVAEREDA